MKSVSIPASVHNMLTAHPEITGDIAHVSLTIQEIHMELLALPVSQTNVEIQI